MAAPPLSAYGSLPGAEGIELSPSGERFATIATIEEKRRLIVGTPDGKVLRVAEVGDRKVNGFWWVGEDHVLARTRSTFRNPFLLAAGKAELSGIANLAISAGKLTSVFDKLPCSGNTVFGNYGSATIDHHTYGFFGAVRYIRTATGECMVDTGLGVLAADLYRVDLDTGDAERIARGTGRPGSWVVGADGNVVAHDEYDGNDDVWRLYAGDGHDRKLMEIPAPAEVPGLEGPGRTQGTVLVYEPGNDQDAVIEVNAGTGAQEELEHGENGDTPLRDPVSNLLLGFDTNDADYPEVFNKALRARLKATRRAFPGYQVRIDSYSADFNRLIAFTDGGDDSGTYWLVNIQTGKADPIGYAYPKIRAEDVGPTRMFDYKAADGLALDGVLTLPPGNGKKELLPVIVLPHGGPIGVHDSIGFDWWAQAYASAGYAVFQPNYRGSSGGGTAFRKAGYGEWGGKMLSDIADGLAALVAAKIVDPHRACIVGGSYGGYAALAGVTLQQGLYRCAVSVAGLSDMPAFLTWVRRGRGSESESLHFLREATGVGEDGNIDATSRISPSEMAGRADAPILLIHGIDDTVVPIAQSVAMEKALEKADKPVKLIRMKGEDHWLSRSRTRTEMLEASMAFVKQYNPPD